MASLKDTEQLAQGIEELVKELRSELKNGQVDFEKLAAISDQISEQADGMAETFSNVNEALMDRIEQVTSGTSQSSGRRQESRSGAKANAGGS